MTAPEQLPPEVEAIALAVIEAEAKKRKTVVKALIGSGYDEGEKRTFRTPSGKKLGLVYRTDPDAQWQVVDAAALDADLRSFPGNLVTEVGIAPEDMPEALAVLAAHAPHLLTDTTRVADGVVEAALAQSAATGRPAAAGIEKRTPAGSLVVKPDRCGFEAVGELIQAGLLAWDGSRVLPAADETEGAA